MKTKHLLLLALISTLIMNSCKKDETEPYIPKILGNTRYFDGKFQYMGNYFYDSKGRLIKKMWSDGEYCIYEYLNSTVTYRYFDENSELLQTNYYTLNSKGLAINAIYEFNSKKKAKSICRNIDYKQGETASATFEYNNEGYCIKEIFVNSDEIETYTYTISDGNVVTCTITSNATTKTITTSFLKEKVNTIGNINEGRNYFGKQNRNLISSQTNSGGVYNYTDTYTYEYDSKNRVIKETVNVASTSGSSWVYSDTFTYTD